MWHLRSMCLYGVWCIVCGPHYAQKVQNVQNVQYVESAESTATIVRERKLLIDLPVLLIDLPVLREGYGGGGIPHVGFCVRPPSEGRVVLGRESPSVESDNKSVIVWI
jgi:hypothetical protein